MSGSAIIRALVVLFIGSLFLYWGIFDTPTQLMHDRAANLPPISEARGRLTYIGLGVVFSLFGLWIIRRQLRNAPPFSAWVFGTSVKVLLGLSGVAALAAVGYGFWFNAHQTYVPPTHHVQPASPANTADAGPAPASAPLPAGVPGDESASAPGPLPAAVPQAGGPAPAPAPLPPAGR